MPDTPQTPRDPNFEARIRDSFARQTVMATIGARLDRVEPGAVAIHLPYRDDLTQQDGFLHAGVVTTIVDSACGYAALSLMPPGDRVLSVEFKVNLLAPGAGSYFVATGTVVRSGRTLTVCRGSVVAYEEGAEREIALMQATMIRLSS